MKVFLVTQECDDPYYPPHTLCVCATEERALSMISEWRDTYNKEHHEHMSITDYIKFHELRIEETEVLE